MPPALLTRQRRSLQVTAWLQAKTYMFRPAAVRVMSCSRLTAMLLSVVLLVAAGLLMCVQALKLTMAANPLFSGQCQGS